MPYDAPAKDAMLDHLATLAVKVGLHTGDPGAGSANEVSGGGYARQAATWAATGGDGIASLSAPLSFDVPAVTISWVTIWDSAGTTRYGKVQLGTAVTFSTPGTLTLDGSMDLNA